MFSFQHKFADSVENDYSYFETCIYKYLFCWLVKWDVLIFDYDIRKLFLKGKGFKHDKYYTSMDILTQ